jgi:hypothetical protein
VILPLLASIAEELPDLVAARARSLFDSPVRD